MKIKLNDYIIEEFESYLKGQNLELENPLNMTLFEQFIQLKNQANQYVASELIELGMADYYNFVEITTHRQINIKRYLEGRTNIRTIELPSGKINYDKSMIPLVGDNEYILANGYYECLRPLLKEHVTNQKRKELGFTILITGDQNNTFYQEQVKELESLIEELKEECGYTEGLYSTTCKDKTKRLTLFSDNRENPIYLPFSHYH